MEKTSPDQEIYKEIIGKRINELGDPVAKKISWEPIGKSASFKIRRLEIKDDTAEFKPVISAIIFSLSFIIIGLITMLIVLGSLESKDFPLSEMILQSAMALLFLIGGIYLFIQSTKKIIFDKSIGFFLRGKTYKDNMIEESNDMINLKKIYALQLIPSFQRSRRNRLYVSYQLNMVLNDGKRINIAAYGNSQEDAKSDIRSLGEFLKVLRIWDVSDLSVS